MSEYWLERSQQLENLTQKRTEETVKAVNEMYQAAIESINGRVKTVFDRYCENGSLSEKQALRLLNVSQTQKIREKLLEKYVKTDNKEEKKRFEAILDAPAYADRISRLEALVNEIYSEALSFGTFEQLHLEKRLISEYKYSYYKTTFDIQQCTGEYYDFERLSSGRLKEAIRHKWLGKNYSQRVWDNTDITAEKLKKVILNGIMTGQSVKTMTDALEATIGSSPDEGARYRFSRLIRTEVNYISGQATHRAYKEAEIEEYVFLATLDKRTCHDCGNEKRKSCAELDGKHFKLNEAEVGVNKHPMHPYCRCSDYPYIKGKKGTRSARDENGKTIFIPNDMTYSEWYKKYVEGEEVDNSSRKAYNKIIRDNPKNDAAATEESIFQSQMQDESGMQKDAIIKDEITYRTTRNEKIIITRTIQGEYNVKLPDKSFSRIVNPVFDKYEVFAGKGSDIELRVRDYLAKNYGGNPQNWFHAKGYTKVVDENGMVCKANVHWFEEETVGLCEMFVKGWSRR